MVENSVVKFFLLKKTEGIWGRLNRGGDRNAILQRRQQSLDAVREAAAKTKEEAKGKIAHIRRTAVSNQMKLDEVRRKTIEARKEAELRQERDSLKTWQQELKLDQTCAEQDAESRNKKELLHEWEQLFKQSNESSIAQAQAQAQAPPQLQPVSDAQRKCVAPAKLATLKPGERIIPAPRKSFRVYISFSKKVLPNHLPARESREKELQLLKHSPINNDVIDVSEREPLFLQDKGDKFYRSGDFMSAINAYSSALQKDPSMPLCYANRAACYLQTNQLAACIMDCSTAMRLLGPEDEKRDETGPETGEILSFTAPGIGALNKDYLPLDSLDLLTGIPVPEIDPDKAHEWKQRARSCILSRRGSAKGHLQQFDGAVADFREALALDPSNAELRRVLDCIGSSSS